MIIKTRWLSIFLVFCCLFLATLPTKVNATLVEGTFEGEVTFTYAYGTSIPDGIVTGDHVTGLFSYETDHAVIQPWPMPALYLFPDGPPLDTFSLSINDLTWESGLSEDAIRVQVVNEPSDDYFGITFNTDATFSGIFPGLLSNGGFAGIGLSDITGSMFSDTMLPVSMSDFNNLSGALNNLFTYGGITSLGGWDSENKEIRYDIDFSITNFNLQPVPEPSTMLLLSVGLIVFARVNRKKFMK